MKVTRGSDRSDDSAAKAGTAPRVSVDCGRWPVSRAWKPGATRVEWLYRLRHPEGQFCDQSIDLKQFFMTGTRRAFWLESRGVHPHSTAKGEESMSQIRKFALGAISACVVAMAPMAAKAETIQLGFILDSSGSITAGGWTTIKSGLANAMDLLLTGSDTYEVSVVSFSNSATTVVGPTIIDAGSIAGVKALINGAAFLNSVTNYAAAFSLMQTTLTGSSNFSAGGKSYVNFATDGVQNTGGTGVAERNALIGAGIDNISIEGIGSGIDKADLKTNFCYPAPCTEAPDPFNFPTQGFYIGVANAAGYANAIGNKIRVVTNQTPEPGTIALAGLALAGLGLARRRKTA